MILRSSARFVLSSEVNYSCIHFSPICPGPKRFSTSCKPFETSKISFSMESVKENAPASLDAEQGPKSDIEDVLVQYIVIRKDLVDALKWPLGSIISQGCHASVAAVWTHKDDPDTMDYCHFKNLDAMHKVTLEVKNEVQLLSLSQKLDEAGILHKLWMEQPENFATCLATKPYWKSKVASHFRRLKLCR